MGEMVCREYKRKNGGEGWRRREEGTLMPSVPDIEWKSLREWERLPGKARARKVALGSAFAESERW